MTEMRNTARRRSLILAGGGIKVAFQAGVLQVWLDEAGLRFDHADGASGGTFNLAMYCQGMSGTQIADNWRNLSPLVGLEFNWKQYLKLPYARSLFKLDRWRKNVFPLWGLDWAKIRASDRNATFNVFNFSQFRLEVLTPEQMSEDFLVACVSLPMWFPPVTIDGQIYIDSVYMTDANLEEAVRRGADELWIIWTVSQDPAWDDGFVANYFQIIETSANGHLRRDLERIRRNNDAIRAGETGEFGRPIDVKMLSAEVPMHYLINLNADRYTLAVNRGVEMARQWCRDNGIPLEQPVAQQPPDPTILRFTEEMKGYVGFGETDYQRGYLLGRKSETPLSVRLTICVGQVEPFVTDPAHTAEAVSGFVHCEALGGRLAVERGAFNLFVDDGDPRRKRMRYRLFFRDADGRPLTLSGVKVVEDDPGLDVWRDTTTLFTRILRGHVDQDTDAPVVASGVIRIQPIDFLKELTTFRVEGGSLGKRAAGLARFGAFFTGELWDVYARRLLSWGPF